jgi:hypothetical protein
MLNVGTSAVGSNGLLLLLSKAENILVIAGILGLSKLSEPRDFSSKSPLLVTLLAGETSLSSLFRWWFSL